MKDFELRKAPGSEAQGSENAPTGAGQVHDDQLSDESRQDPWQRKPAMFAPLAPPWDPLSGSQPPWQGRIQDPLQEGQPKDWLSSAATKEEHTPRNSSLFHRMIRRAPSQGLFRPNSSWYRPSAAVQRQADQESQSPTQKRSEAVFDIAKEGVAQGGGQKLPFFDQIQAAFGEDIDLSEVRAHIGGAAGDAAKTIGARAYATGTQIAFAGEPDLHTVAHETTHILQQKAGVQLQGGVGKSGDAYEKQADEVADRVVRGESAKDLLQKI